HEGIKHHFNLSDEGASRAIDSWNRSDVRIPVYNASSVEELSLEELEEGILQYAIENPDKARSALGFADLPEDKLFEYTPELVNELFIPYLQEKLGFSTIQASEIYNRLDIDDLLAGSTLNLRAKVDVKAAKEFKIPYIKQALYHELDRAQEQGLK